MAEPEEHTAFAAALRRAISDKGLSLSATQARLAAHGNRISLATLSYWRSGARHPEGAVSLSAVEDLETILDLDPGSLTALIPPTARLGTLAEPRVPFDEERERRETEETFAALNAAPQVAIRDISTHMTVFTRPDGTVRRTEFQCLIQVTRGIVTELPLIDVAPEETDVMSEIVEVVGGRLDREFQHPGRLVSGIVIALDEPVAAGETAMIEFAEQLPLGYPARRSAWHATARPAKETLIRVIFPEGAEPDWCEEYVESESGEEFAGPATFRGRIAHAVRHGFGPGVLGLRWGGSSAAVDAVHPVP
ncbi:hypothetical protein [Microbacterium sp. 2MCAF23]|uniref:hypothetical protein n=1 Tax=Microbacterium sp. 2MCAF23 TaxID=3232985 RepID=UPI003F982F9E